MCVCLCINTIEWGKTRVSGCVCVVYAKEREKCVCEWGLSGVKKAIGFFFFFLILQETRERERECLCVCIARTREGEIERVGVCVWQRKAEREERLRECVCVYGSHARERD